MNKALLLIIVLFMSLSTAAEEKEYVCYYPKTDIYGDEVLRSEKDRAVCRRNKGRPSTVAAAVFACRMSDTIYHFGKKWTKKKAQEKCEGQLIDLRK
jgi:hypothetical protein